MIPIIPTRASAVFGLCLCLTSFSFSQGASAQQPYAGQESREIKSLSETDVEDLLAGRGWGLAKPAELNGYPGPSHVLDASEDLNLTPQTRTRIEAIFDTMNAEARRLGVLYVEAETRLEEAFAGGTAKAEDLRALLAEAGSLRTQLRLVHLQAHLETAPLLTRHQKMIYARLRGYQGGTGHSHGGNH
ncbi:hypothetical protein [Roseibium sp.]|uniref:hypothetical protein n=1 Tax=Roseibium sp. TaxID=1936156 RepID=UPI003266E5DE